MMLDKKGRDWSSRHHFQRSQGNSTRGRAETTTLGPKILRRQQLPARGWFTWSIWAGVRGLFGRGCQRI
eukprot:15982670-Heterocapsa_arctica.AAC.1